MHQFNKKLSELRKSLRLTQVEMAQKLDMTQAAISILENGGSMPTGATLAKLEQVYPTLDWNIMIKGGPGGFFIKKSTDVGKPELDVKRRIHYADDLNQKLKVLINELIHEHRILIKTIEKKLQ